MNEKAYKAMGLAGAAGIAVGIVVTVIGIAAGVISIISGARLLKEKKGIRLAVCSVSKAKMKGLAAKLAAAIEAAGAKQ